MFSRVIELLRLQTRSRVKRPSTRKMLSAVISRKQWDALCTLVPDRRELIARAAKELSMSEEALLMKVAPNVGLTVLTRVQPMEGNKITNPSLEELRSAGSILLMKDGKVTGLICADPSSASPLTKVLGELPVFLAPWSSIQKALEASEEELRRTQSKQGEEGAKRREKLALDVLSIVTEEVSREGSGKFYLERFDAGLQYSFKPIAEANLKKGQIHPKIAETLWNIVSVGQTRVLQVKVRTAEEKLFLSCSQLEAALIEISLSEKNPVEKNLKVVDTTDVPRKVIEMPERTRQVVSFPGARNDKPVVVILEDNIDFARVLTRYFKRYPIEIIHYTDGAAALCDISDERIKPDLAICDLHMPSMHGLEFLKRIRNDLKAAGLPVIMLTSDDELETQIKLLESGADVFLAKSTHPRVLEAHVRRILNVAPSHTVAA